MTDQDRIAQLEQENARLLRSGEKTRDELFVGRELVGDLIKRHFVDGDDCDAQVRRLCFWARMPVPEGW